MEYELLLGLFVAFIIFLTAAGRINEKKRWKWLEEQHRNHYGQASAKKYKDEEWKTVSSYYIRHKDPKGIDDITWNDLGMDEVFQRMDYTESSVGEEFLYYMLRTPCYEEKDLEQREKRIRAMEKEEVRLPLQMQLMKVGRSGKYAIWDYLDLLDNLGERSSLLSVVVDLFILGMIPMCFINVGIGVLGIIAGVLFNFLRYFKQKGEIDPYIVSFSYLLRLLEGAEQIADVLQKTGEEILQEDARRITEQVREFRKYRRNSRLILSPTRMSGSSDPVELVMDYIRMTFHLDILKFNQMLGQVRGHLTQIESLMTVTGQLDASVSIQCYRAFLEQKGQAYCIPVFTPDKKIILQKGVHPLLEQPVANSVETEKNVLITGSNASGKSTFLKTVAIAALMAQSVHMVLAQGYQACFFRIYSSMALRDDLLSGESYYMAEIKALKRIMDGAKADEKPVLCFVDEVLRGTNTVERIAASVEILHYMAGQNLLCFTATHDIELTKLLGEAYENYHFAEEFDGTQIYFTYEIRKGEAASRNAIRLLDMIGFEKEITARAERRAEHFLQTGTW